MRDVLVLNQAEGISQGYRFRNRSISPRSTVKSEDRSCVTSVLTIIRIRGMICFNLFYERHRPAIKY
jgi:hypothetical protein